VNNLISCTRSNTVFWFYLCKKKQNQILFLLWSSNGGFHDDPRTIPRLSENWYFVWKENPAMTNNIFFELSYRGTIREGFIIVSIERLSCFLQDISRDISMESTTIIKVDLRNDVKCVNVLKFIACLIRSLYFWIYVSNNLKSNFYWNEICTYIIYIM